MKEQRAFISVSILGEGTYPGTPGKGGESCNKTTTADGNKDSSAGEGGGSSLSYCKRREVLKSHHGRNDSVGPTSSSRAPLRETEIHERVPAKNGPSIAEIKMKPVNESPEFWPIKGSVRSA